MATSIGERVGSLRPSLIAEAGAQLLVVRLAVWLLPFHTVRRRIDAIRPRRKAREDVAEVVRAVDGVARRFPLRVTCLVHALTAQAMLRRRGYPCALRFGVRAPVRAGAVEAHAWLEHGGAVVIGRLPDLSDYRALRGASSAVACEADSDQPTAPALRNSPI
jgi:Transglutaminase-like superfamily